MLCAPLNDEKPGWAFIPNLSGIASCIVLASMVSLVSSVSKLHFGTSTVDGNYMNKNSDQQHLQKHIRREATGNLVINVVFSAGIVYAIVGSRRKAIAFSGGDGSL